MITVIITNKYEIDNRFQKNTALSQYRKKRFLASGYTIDSHIITISTKIPPENDGDDACFLLISIMFMI